MPKKIKLELSELKVESFRTSEQIILSGGSPAPGTGVQCRTYLRGCPNYTRFREICDPSPETEKQF